MSASMSFSTTRPLYGQVAIVTGSGRGIGRGIAIALAKAGAHVVVNYRQSREQAESVAAQCREFGIRSITVQADVTIPGEVMRLVNAACSLGPVSILVNNAGIAKTQLFMQTSLEDWETLLRNNLTAPFLCTQAVLPHMMKTGYGRIVNVASVWGLTGGACEVAYSATKGGLVAFTKALAKEVARAGVTVNAVAPGAIDTDMLRELSEEDLAVVAEETPVGRIGQPDDVAYAVLFLVSPRASYITGQVISPNGGFLT